MKHRYLIKLQDATYDVRVDGNKREILYNCVWVDPDSFVDLLIQDEQWPKVAELAKLGHSIWRERQ